MRKERLQTNSNEYGEEYYDNTVYQGAHSMAHYPAIGYPVHGYKPDVSFEEGSITSPYYRYRGQNNLETGLDENPCVYQA